MSSGRLRSLLTLGALGSPGTTRDGGSQPSRRRYALTPRSTNLETITYSASLGPVGRDAALSVPTIAACRNLIVGAAIQMGVYRYRGNERLEPGLLLTQPDPSTTWPATLGGTLDDLLFHGRAYWLILAGDSNTSEQHPAGFPVRARWIPYEHVTPRLSGGPSGAYSTLVGYTIAGERDVVPVDEVIRFDSPLPGILVTGARTIATAFEQEDAASRFARVDLPMGVLINEGPEIGVEDARALRDEFIQARLDNDVALLQGVTYERTEVSPADLQLVEGRAHLATECARLFNVPVTMVGASPTGGASAMLYANLGANLSLLVNGAVAPHLRTIEATLSLDQWSPHGQTIAFDVLTFLRSDPEAAAQYAIELLNAEIIDRDEARSFIGIPSPSAPTADLTPGRI
jgi:Phage portal protein